MASATDEGVPSSKEIHEENGSIEIESAKIQTSESPTVISEEGKEEILDDNTADHQCKEKVLDKDGGTDSNAELDEKACENSDEDVKESDSDESEPSEHENEENAGADENSEEETSEDEDVDDEEEEEKESGKQGEREVGKGRNIDNGKAVEEEPISVGTKLGRGAGDRNGKNTRSFPENRKILRGMPKQNNRGKKVESMDKPESSRNKKAKGEPKSSGMIFMCSSETKNDCYRYQIFGLPESKKNVVEQVYAGMRLFLYDVDLKLMYGIYKAARPGGYNIEPKAFNSQFPSQVRFKVLKDCLPLAEEKFRKAIKDNYYTKSKFDCRLDSQQVRKLCQLFASSGSLQPEMLGVSKINKSRLKWPGSSSGRRAGHERGNALAKEAPRSGPPKRGNALATEAPRSGPSKTGNALATEASRTGRPKRGYPVATEARRRPADYEREARRVERPRKRARKAGGSAAARPQPLLMTAPNNIPQYVYDYERPLNAEIYMQDTYMGDPYVPSEPSQVRGGYYYRDPRDSYMEPDPYRGRDARDSFIEHDPYRGRDARDALMERDLYRGRDALVEHDPYRGVAPLLDAYPEGRERYREPEMVLRSAHGAGQHLYLEQRDRAVSDLYGGYGRDPVSDVYKRYRVEDRVAPYRPDELLDLEPLGVPRTSVLTSGRLGSSYVPVRERLSLSSSMALADPLYSAEYPGRRARFLRDYRL